MYYMINGGGMASMTIRDIYEKLKSRLRIQAARHGRSMEDEARDILRSALSREPTQSRGLFEALRARVEAPGRRERGSRTPRPSARAGELRQMIVLDTNVLSEVLRPAPEPRVVDWLK